MKRLKFNNIKIGLVYLFTSFILFIVVGFSFIGIQLTNEKDLVVLEQENSILDATTKLNSNISQVGIDILTIKNVILVKDVADQSDLFTDSEYMGRIENLSLSWLKLKKGYDQMRIINLDGDEVLRINQATDEPITVPESELQNKSGETYFDSMKDLVDNEIIISDFNLNRENGEIEIRDGKVVPTFRVMTPLYHTKNNVNVKFGYIVLNVLTDRLTSDFIGTNIELINDDNFYIFSNDNVLLYGCMYGDDGKNSTYFETHGINISEKERKTSSYSTFSKVTTYNKITSADVNEVIQVLATPNIKIDNSDTILTVVSSYNFMDSQTYKSLMIGLIVVGVLMLILSYSVALFVDKRHEERKTVLANYKRIANTDELTKIGNRKKCFSDLKKRYYRKGTFTVLFCDLDKFKFVNDTYGHDIGDDTLIEITIRINELLDENTKLYRIGGDEFLLICEFTDKDKLKTLAKNIIDSCNKPIVFGDCVVKIGISIGISILDNRDKSIDELVEEADSAMYETKRKDKNNYNFYK